MSKRFQHYPKLISYSILFGTLGTGCASSQKATQPDPEKDAEMNATKALVQKLEDRILDLETRLGALNEKFNLLNAERPEEKPATEQKKIVEEKVQSPPAVKTGLIPKSVKPVSKFAESFHQDEATDRYREAKILFETKKYSDAILEFSEFIKDNPRHVFASNAQFFIGMSYYRQNEFRIAEEELSRVLMNYPHSNAVPDTLLALAKVSDALKKPARVTYYREKLNDHFANSPQSKQLSLETLESETSNTPATATAPAVAPETAPDSISEKPKTPEPPVAPTAEMGEPSVVKQ